MQHDAPHAPESDSWTYEICGWEPSEISLNGSRFLIGNGLLGVRGTLEEHGATEQAGCLVNGLYDQAPGKWREPVNVPNGLYTRIGDATEIIRHRQWIDLRNAVMGRETAYRVSGREIRVSSRRFASQSEPHLICLEYTITADDDCALEVETGIDTGVWDINGPHWSEASFQSADQILTCRSITRELGVEIVVGEYLEPPAESAHVGGIRRIEVKLAGGEVWKLRKFISVFTALDQVESPEKAVRELCASAAARGFDGLLAEHSACWNTIWNRSDVRITGDDEAQLALRYSIYQLNLAAPRHSDKVSIPARGLSGQVYKGAVFWDTEMFMTPVFTLTEPEVARNLILYRYHTLGGARRKAAEYGFRGAFYAWESQETGDDACTLFNVTDVFTGRPMRTYFRDKQIHISADIVYAIRSYVDHTGDCRILADGAAEVAAECARFLHSYAVYKPERGRFELHDVTGPDEYHERVNNNAFTNRMARHALESAVALLETIKEAFPDEYHALDLRIGFSGETARWSDMAATLYQQQPDPVTGVIPQFDGYMDLEDVTLGELKSRMLDPNEYLGGGNGLATQTRILKQADVVLMLHLFPNDHPGEIVRANWEYYGPRTEHGSSLSACAYAMVAARIGQSDWAYDYFMKTATVDLTGKSKQYVGTLYIGGTHPAANGGAWMSAVMGFAGLTGSGSTLQCASRLPSRWNGMEFHVRSGGRSYRAAITHQSSTLETLNPTEP